MFFIKPTVNLTQASRLLRQPCWPFWQWPVAWQWGLGALAVLGAMGLGAAWWWTERAAWMQIDAQLGVVHLQLNALRQKASVLNELPEADQSLRPSWSAMGSLSAQWVAKAEQAGLRVSQWSISPPAAVASSSSQALDHPPAKAGFSVQVQGPYTSIKSWLGQLLQAQPWMVLDKLQLRTADVGNGILEAQISWNIYVED